MHEHMEAADAADRGPAQPMTGGDAQAAGQPVRTWDCPGIPPRRNIFTWIGVLAAAALFFFIAMWQGASMVVSTFVGLVFIGGFVWYLRTMRPTPFTLRVDASGVTRTDRGGEPREVPWDSVAKVKEEQFKSGQTISVAVFKRVGERGLFRAFVVYRDDVGDFDGFLGALRAGTPAERPWLIDTVHE